MAPAAKKQKTETQWVQATQDDLTIGTMVLYESSNGFRSGSVVDSFDCVDHYWVEDQETGEVIRGDSGEITDFFSNQLRVAKVLHLEEPAPQEEPSVDAGVLLIGTGGQLEMICEHFGAPSVTSRTTPQQLLCVACTECLEGLPRRASEGVHEGLKSLAQSLRDDIPVALRVAHLKEVTRQLGESILKLKEHSLLASVHLPFDSKAIGEVSGMEQQHRRDLWNQIDLLPTAVGESARAALGEQCAVDVSDQLWAKDSQEELRVRLGVPMLPFVVKDTLGAEITVLVLPKDAAVTTIKGVLCFSKPAAIEAPPSEAVHDFTVRQWEAMQHEFKGLPQLPAPWLRVRSRSSGEVYFYNKETRKATFELPEPRPLPPPPPPPPVAVPRVDGDLPPGWTQHVSQSTGKVYYFHAASNVSSYYWPKA